MFSVTNVFTSQLGDLERTQYARVRNSETGEERLLERFELKEPDDVEVGDTEAYKVSLASDGIKAHYGTHQFFFGSEE